MARYTFLTKYNMALRSGVGISFPVVKIVGNPKIINGYISYGTTILSDEMIENNKGESWLKVLQVNGKDVVVEGYVAYRIGLNIFGKLTDSMEDPNLIEVESITVIPTYKNGVIGTASTYYLNK
ncbi:MAG: hypothetical protein WA061_02230 [Microgenomates group bacterium]